MERPRRLLLHAGTPKTGSTSLQFTLDRCHDALKAQGILYPRWYEEGSAVPKHQWIVASLRSTSRAEHYSRYIEQIRQEFCQGVHTVLLSTEGLFNHWWDFGKDAKRRLAELNDWARVQVLVFFREPLSFAVSLYKQSCCNPRSDVFCYGRDLSFEEMLNDDWFARHLDYAGFVEDCEAVFGPGSVIARKYEEGSVIAAVQQLLGVEGCDGDEQERRNVSLGFLGLELVRVINRFPIDPSRKRAAVACVREIESVVSMPGLEIPVGRAAKARVEAMSERSRAFLERRFSIRW